MEIDDKSPENRIDNQEIKLIPPLSHPGLDRPTLIDLQPYPVDRVRTEITQGPIADIRIRIGRGSRLKVIVAGNVHKGKEIIVDPLIDTIHIQLQRIPFLQIGTIVEQGLLDIFPVRKTILKNENIRYRPPVDGLRELVVITRTDRVQEIYDGIDILVVVEIGVLRKGDGIQGYIAGHRGSGLVLLPPGYDKQVIPMSGCTVKRAGSIGPRIRFI